MINCDDSRTNLCQKYYLNFMKTTMNTPDVNNNLLSKGTTNTNYRLKNNNLKREKKIFSKLCIFI